MAGNWENVLYWIDWVPYVGTVTRCTQSAVQNITNSVTPEMKEATAESCLQDFAFDIIPFGKVAKVGKAAVKGVGKAVASTSKSSIIKAVTTKGVVEAETKGVSKAVEAAEVKAIEKIEVKAVEEAEVKAETKAQTDEIKALTAKRGRQKVSASVAAASTSIYAINLVTEEDVSKDANDPTLPILTKGPTIGTVLTEGVSEEYTDTFQDLLKEQDSDNTLAYIGVGIVGLAVVIHFLR